ncbi:nucleoside kinase [Saccharicrinis fermentans]|uniref:Uridine kinase n=1 Tax=Saccharicrinis fermentans DSM 9555 = JCM 21142 TaxID=869213 RepID=W7Y2Y9_9BACT|nr:nucleoside kinase [Saccharicrinis fermentans]GAF05190.1 uridine kinase [Saccharicrinis fermentans DSM 9555 = JCM 21142]
MSQQIEIKCVNNNTYKTYNRGVTLKQIADDHHIKLRSEIIGAMVNNSLEQLSYEVFHPKTVEFIDITNPDGMRMYIRSLSFLLYYAVENVLPGTKLSVEHSVSRGVYCKLDGPHEVSFDEISKLSEYMRNLVQQDIPFEYYQKETEKVIELFKEQGFEDKIGLLESRGHHYSSYYQLKDTIASFYGYLVPSTAYLKVFDVNKYYDGILLQIPRRFEPEEVERMVIQNKMFEIFQEYSHWSKVLKVTNIHDLNTLQKNNKAQRLIKVSEAFHEKKIGHIAERKDHVRIILISGPSSSGKTTFSKRLAIQLMVNGLRPHTLSLDNYFVDREKTPLDENGDYDFEALEALDIDQFNQDLSLLLKGEKVDLPKFSFETGKRYYDNTKIRLKKNDILVIEGIHGLTPELTHNIPDSFKFKIYVSALTSINIDSHNRIPTTDNRLIRRIVRDYKYRNYSAVDTLSRWQSVRRGEDKHIFPYQEEADVMFNTALLYELAVLKPLVEPMLLEVPHNKPEYAEASRLLYFFSYFDSIQSHSIPPTSILREFLGGSSFDY